MRGQTQQQGGKRLAVGVWDDTCQAYDQGDGVAQWLCEFLGEVGQRVWCGVVRWGPVG